MISTSAYPPVPVPVLSQKCPSAPTGRALVKVDAHGAGAWNMARQGPLKPHMGAVPWEVGDDGRAGVAWRYGR
jgi:hypothetical protein